MVWNISVIPIYILSGIKKIPMNLDPLEHFNHLKIIERIGVYSGLGIFIVMITIILLSIPPIFIAGFQQPLWVIVWAQFTLLYFYSIITIRFQRNSIVKIILLIFAYILLRYGIGTSQTGGPIVQGIQSLGISSGIPIKEYAELLLFSFLAAYLFYLKSRVMYTIIKEIKEDYKTRKLQFYRNIVKEIEEKIKEGYRQKPISGQGEGYFNSLNSLLGICEKIEKEPVESIFYQQTIRVMGLLIPFLTTVIPILIDYLK